MKVKIPYGKDHITFEHDNISRIVESRTGEMKAGKSQDELVLRRYGKSFRK